jgi:hypothetical protein
MVWLLSWAKGWMLVINISEISAVATQIRATARGNEMIIVRGIRRTFPTSLTPGGGLLTVQAQKRRVITTHQRANSNKSVGTSGQ